MFDFYAMYESFGGFESLESYGRLVAHLEEVTGVDYLDFDEQLDGWADFEESLLDDPDDCEYDADLD